NINKISSIVEYIRALGFKMATFDKNDSISYNMSFFPQFYREYKEELETINYKQDFFFCGRDKGRKEFINRMKEKLSQIGTCKFIITNTISQDAMGYNKYIEELKNSRVVCEAVQTGQEGLTVRALEALFLKKKLITNNVRIKEYDFFHPNNIFVISEDTDVLTVQDFLDRPYTDVDKDIIKNYDVYHLLNYLSNL
ncbi:MAG: hypothetical protein K6E54_08935, partial [Bacteroidaceae bacterium]|nr:hypothetical protein [Bacteroidaceae bacterium]